MSTLAPFALMLANLAEMTDDQFRSLVDGLRRELAPTNFLEQFLVERITLFINRMRRSARVEAEGQPPDARWLRYESAAERGFWNAYKELMKGRRPQAKAASKTEPAAPRSAAPPPPAPVAPAPAARAPQPSSPAMTAPSTSPAPTRPAPARLPDLEGPVGTGPRVSVAQVRAKVASLRAQGRHELADTMEQYAERIGS